MAPKQITLAWLEKNLWSNIPDMVFTQVPILQKVHNYLRKLEAEKLRSLPVNLLTEGEVRKMFNLELRSAKDLWSLDNHEIQPVPDLLLQMLAVTRHALENTFEEVPPNEACARVILNPILLCLISEEKTRASRQASSLTAPSILASDRPTTPIQRKELQLRFETELKCPVTYRNEHCLLSGFADYSLWYPDENGPSPNLIIVEAKKTGTSEAASGQLLAYMAIVHRTRKDQRKQNAIVYGMTTDSNLFRFFRIDNESKVSRSKILEWRLGEEEPICSYIRYIIRAAIASSPSTSPLKSDKTRELALASFGTEEAAFDYDISAYEEEDDSSELLELPDLDISNA